jgi:hypothetical protein
MIEGTKGAFLALNTLSGKLIHWAVSCGIIFATQVAILIFLRWQGITGTRLELIGLLTTIIVIGLVIAHTIHAFG